MTKIYKCPKCGKVFKGKSGYEYHIYKIGTPCNANTINGQDGTKKNLLKKYLVTKPAGSDLITIKSDKKEHEHVDHNSQNMFSIVNKNGNEQYQCKMCGKVYVSEKYLRTHIEKKWCLNGNKNNLVETLMNVINKNFKNPKKSIVINNHYHNQVVNNNITNNNVTNITNNSLNIFESDGEIKVNAFGKENLGILTPELMDKIIEHPMGGIINLIKIIHFNPDVPENMNVIMENKKDPYFNVFNGEIWEKKPKDITIHNLLTTKKDIMDDHFEMRDENRMIGNFLKVNYNNFSDLLDPMLRARMKDEWCIGFNSILEGELEKQIEITDEKREMENKKTLKICQKLYQQLYNGISLLVIQDKKKLMEKNSGI